MLFNSVEFLVFFLAVLFLNAALGQRLAARSAMLLVASYIFYSSWNGYYLALIVVSTLIDYVAALRVARSTTPAGRRTWLVLSLVANLGILGTFKYFNFFVDSAHVFFSAIGLPFQYSTLQLLLPIGISFYTFQSMSYTIDVYAGRIEPEKRLLNFALYIAFFPQLIAGPIVRAVDFLPQLGRPYRLSREDFFRGTGLVWIGLFKKVVFADFFARYSDAYFMHLSEPQSLLSALIGVYSFAFQIYFDFSGYTDTAIGAALLLGFKIPRNFNYPYAATSMNDLWRRWHISLSTWMRDYLYISLGGNRTGHAPRNVMLTMGLSGLWHGAGWPFVVWGLMHGFAVNAGNSLAARVTRRPPRWLSSLLVFQVTCLGWLVFRIPAIEDLSKVAVHATHWLPDRVSRGECLALGLAGGLFVYQQFATALQPKDLFYRAPAWVQTVAHAGMMTLVVALGEFGNPFIYFQF